MADESYDRMTHDEITWGKSLEFGALLALLLSIEWLQGDRPSAMTFAVVLLLLIASMVAVRSSSKRNRKVDHPPDVNRTAIVARLARLLKISATNHCASVGKDASTL